MQKPDQAHLSKARLRLKFDRLGQPLDGALWMQTLRVGMKEASKAQGAAEAIIAILKTGRDTAAGGDSGDLDLVPPRTAA